MEDENEADRVRNAYQTYIKENRYTTHNITVSEYSSNYCLYTVKAKGLYTINMHVANTLVFAECQEENAGKLNKIMTDFGYFDK